MVTKSEDTLTATCLCQDGYHLDEDGRSCVKGTQTLLYTDQLSVVVVDLESNSEAVLDLGKCGFLRFVFVQYRICGRRNDGWRSNLQRMCA